ncbi:CPBP family intramembrane glutamic endopeptidase [Paenibacillus sp. sgz500958]|uniref:CPBP family intramembrane glutamic endopeptidase n=1 Tax=Paenibacillus sp. sgz500958 TaxID=3242475 RepID=UPI0036D43C8E
MPVLHLLVLYLLLVTPVWGYYSYAKYKREYRIHPGIKITYYKKTVVELWALAAVFTGCVYWKGIPWPTLGLAEAQWGRISVMLLFGLGTFTAAPLIMMKGIPGYRETMHKQLKELDEFLPSGQPEKRFWIWVSLTAGICEEWLFRSMMFYYIPLVIPGVSFLWVMLLSSLLFGLGHYYQGGKGVMSAMIMGLMFGGLYYYSGAVWLCMLFHFLIDVRIILMLPKGISQEPVLEK